MSYDRSTLFQQCDDDPVLVRRVVALFLTDSEAQLDTLRQALAQGDAQRLFSVAHSIKGAVGSFGAAHARSAAVAVEACCRSGRLEDAAPFVDELVRSVRALAQALRCAAL